MIRIFSTSLNFDRWPPPPNLGMALADLLIWLGAAVHCVQLWAVTKPVTGDLVRVMGNWLDKHL